MDFRILGPLEVSENGHAVDIGKGRQRALLAYLLIHRNESVSRGRLVDQLWDADPPATATKVLQNYVVLLRKALGRERIVTDGRGYLLRVGSEEVDVARFERFVANADGAPPELAARTLADALKLWRGPALAEFDDTFAREEAERLDQRRILAVSMRIAADLDLGKHDTLIPELEILSRQQPLVERFHAQLMLALYRSGRQADALTAYRRARDTLITELGVEPGPELQQLQKAILAHDPTLEAPRSARPRVVHGRRRIARIVAAAAAVLTAAAIAMVLRPTSTSPRPHADTIVRYDAVTGHPASVAPVGNAPRAVLATAGAIWVANYDDKTVTRIDRRSRRAVTVGTGAAPTALADGAGAVWALSTTDGNLTRLDPATGHITAIVAVGVGAGALACDGSGVWLTNENEGTLIHVRAASLATQVVRRHLGGPAGVAVTGRRVWVAEAYRQRLLQLDAATARTLHVIPLRFAPAAVTADTRAVWVTYPAHAEVSRLDVATRSPRYVRVGANPIGVSSNGRRAWVINDASHSITELNARTGAALRTIFLTHGNPVSTTKHPVPLLTPGGGAVEENGDAWVSIDSF